MLHEYITDAIVIDGDDLIVEGQVLPFKQKLVFAGMSYNEDISAVIGRGGPQAFGPLGPGYAGYQPITGNSVDVRIYAMIFKKDATKPDGYGERVSAASHIKEYEITLRANNSTLVDNATGVVLGQAGDELLTVNTQAALYDAEQQLVQAAGKLYGKEYIREGQFFDRMGDQEFQPGVRQLLRQYITLNKSRIQPKS